MTTYSSKLKIGQDAWWMHENKPVCQPVEAVRIEVTLDENGKDVRETVGYGFRTYFGDRNNASRKFKEWVRVSQSQCFPTKEELLASL